MKAKIVIWEEVIVPNVVISDKQEIELDINNTIETLKVWEKLWHTKFEIKFIN